MQIEPLRLPVLFVPAEIEPLQPLEDRIQRCFGIALEIRIVDAQDHGSAIVPGIQPVEDERAGAADVQIAGRRGREANSH